MSNEKNEPQKKYTAKFNYFGDENSLSNDPSPAPNNNQSTPTTNSPAPTTRTNPAPAPRANPAPAPRANPTQGNNPHEEEEEEKKDNAISVGYVIHRYDLAGAAKKNIKYGESSIGKNLIAGAAIAGPIGLLGGVIKSWYEYSNKSSKVKEPAELIIKKEYDKNTSLLTGKVEYQLKTSFNNQLGKSSYAHKKDAIAFGLMLANSVDRNKPVTLDGEISDVCQVIRTLAKQGFPKEKIKVSTDLAESIDVNSIYQAYQQGSPETAGKKEFERTYRKVSREYLATLSETVKSYASFTPDSINEPPKMVLPCTEELLDKPFDNYNQNIEKTINQLGSNAPSILRNVLETFKQQIPNANDRKKAYQNSELLHKAAIQKQMDNSQEVTNNPTSSKAPPLLGIKS